MKIQSPSTILFKNYIRIPLKDKSRGSLSTVKTPMDRVISIASDNKVPLYVSQDVFVLGSSDKIKKDLQKSNIEYQEIEETDERKN